MGHKMEASNCYKFCNTTWGMTEPDMRLYCKKGCDADDVDNIEQCKTDFCSSLCIKDELGDDGDKKGAWTSLFARAPMASDKCLDACYAGCLKKDYDDDD